MQIIGKRKNKKIKKITKLLCEAVMCCKQFVTALSKYSNKLTWCHLRKSLGLIG
jgi:hypothetical protein